MLRTIVFVLAWVCFSLSAATYQSHRLQGQQLLIQTDESVIQLSAKSDYAIEVLHRLAHEQTLPSFALATDQTSPIQLEQHTDKLLFKAAQLTAEISLPDLQIRFTQNQQLVIEEERGAFSYPGIRGFRFKLQADEKIMGGGQRVMGMDRRGQRMPLYNRAHYGYTTESKQMYYGLPAVMSDRKYAVLFDNSAKGNLDIGHTESDILQFEALSGRLAYIVVAHETYPKLIGQLTQITGRQPLPPRWILGNFASRFGYRNEQQTRDVVTKMIEADFPLDAVVLDLYWFGKDIKGMMGNLDWDRQAFPNPRKMIADFQKQGVETILITEPFILSTSDKWQDAKSSQALATGLGGQVKRFDFYFGNTGLVDVFSPAGQSWFANVYKRLSLDGVTGWWGDLGEPEVHPHDLLHRFNEQLIPADMLHNVYGHQWANLLFQTLSEVQPDKRPMVLMRSGFLGSQRYGMIPWTGDVSRSWEGLKPQVELSLQMSLFGLAYTHSDLGGFAGGETFDSELYIRWMQYGVFQPIYRPHGQENIAPEPIFHDKRTQDVVRQAIKMRYALLPYNYSLAFENSLTGMPLMRPMAFEDETRQDYFEMTEQYLWGDSFLVKTITDPGVKTTSVTLPEGVWFDFYRGQRHVGGQTVDVDTSIEHLPVFVRAGAFIPMAPDIQHTKAYPADQLYVHYYHDPSVTNAAYTMYEDDGISPKSIETQQYQTLKMVSTSVNNAIRLDFTLAGDYPLSPVAKMLSVSVHNIVPNSADMQVFVSQPDGSGATRAPLSREQFSYNKQLNRILLHVEVKKHTKVEIFY